MKNVVNVSYIPSNLNLTTLLAVHPTSMIKNFKLDNLIYIIGLIVSIPANNKDLLTSKGFVPISSAMMQKRIRNYNQYIDYLLLHHVFVTDNHFINFIKSRGYKYGPLYNNAPVVSVQITDNQLLNSIFKTTELTAAKKKKYNHLVKWYNQNLQIDDETAIAFIEADLKRKIDNPDLSDLDKNGYPKDPYLQYNCALLNIQRIKAGNFNISIDDNVKRLHSTISNFRGMLRNCISFGGRKLLSIDIKNSQPYLSTVLFNNLFWEDVNMCNYRTDFSINLFYDKYFKGIFNNKDNRIDSFVTLVNNYVSQAESDIHRYKTLVQQGVFYKYLGDEFTKELGLDYRDKKYLKPIVFLVFFTHNSFLAQEGAEHKRIFKNLFPDLYQIFSLIKKSDKTNLPRLLQRIESHLMLNVITRRIAAERKDIPIFTIHDSIITTDELGNAAYIQMIMEEEFTNAIGFPPKFEIEYWDVANLAFNDGTKFNSKYSKVA